MRRGIRRLGPICAVLAFFLCGCSSAEIIAPKAGIPAVFAYTPPSPEEAGAQAQVLSAAQRVTVEVRRADGVLDALKERYGEAAKQLQAEAQTAGEPRSPTEEMKALREEIRLRWHDRESLLIDQVDRFEEFLDRYPHNWYARHRYAWFLDENNMRYEAAQEWQRVIQLEPAFPYAYNNLGSLYNHMGRDMEAVDLFLKAIELHDTDPTFHENLAVNYSTHRNEVAEKFGWDLPRVFHECMVEYRRALELAPTDIHLAREVATQHVLAKYFGVADNPEQEIEDWKYYLSLELTDNQRGAACRSIGRIYLTRKNDYAAAQEWLEKALECFVAPDPSSKLLLERARKAAAEDRTPTTEEQTTGGETR